MTLISVAKVIFLLILSYFFALSGRGKPRAWQGSLCLADLIMQ